MKHLKNGLTFVHLMKFTLKQLEIYLGVLKEP